jgi:NAD(P)-dependent dehydrogenase (short-subunit alcohol dehydrogenase family)
MAKSTKQGSSKPKSFPGEKQTRQPGREHKMDIKPEFIRKNYKGSDKLKGKVALITGGDSGIGRAVAVHFAREGADIAIIYLDEDKDAKDTMKLVEKEGRKCLIIKGDIGDEKFCRDSVKQTRKALGGLNILVNNAAEQHSVEDFDDVTSKQVIKTFETNIFSFFYLTHEALKKMKKGDTIINSTSVTAFRGSEHLIDYASTKGAILSFTRSLAKNLAEKGIRVNAVAPGPVWTPLIVSTFEEKKIKEFGQDVPLGRAGQPSEIAPAYVFLASDDGSYITGQTIHVNGGEIVGG